jgi:hypothetical protein
VAVPLLYGELLAAASERFVLTVCRTGLDSNNLEEVFVLGLETSGVTGLDMKTPDGGLVLRLEASEVTVFENLEEIFVLEVTDLD